MSEQTLLAAIGQMTASLNTTLSSVLDMSLGVTGDRNVASQAAATATASMTLAQTAAAAAVAAAGAGPDGGAGLNAILAADAAALANTAKLTAQEAATAAAADKVAAIAARDLAVSSKAAAEAALATVTTLAAAAAASATAAAAAGGGGGGGPASVVPLTYGATVLWPASLNSIATLTLAGNAVMGTPTGLLVGTYPLHVYRGGTAGHTLGWSSAYKFAGGQVPEGSTAANTLDIWEISYNGTVLSAILKTKGILLAAEAPAVLAAPAGVATSNPTETTMGISGTPVVGAIGYNIYRNGLKVNAVLLASPTYTDTGLTAGTAYSWTLKTVNAASVEGAASAAATGTTTAIVATVQGLTPMPAQVFGCYHTGWLNNTKLTDISVMFNVIYLFHGTPNGPNKDTNNNGDGGFEFKYFGNVSKNDVQTCRLRGQKVILTVGGQNNGYNFDNRTKSTNFVNSFKAMALALGGVDGCDFNNFENGVNSNTAEMIWIAQQLRAEYGANFAITAPPAPDAQYDKDMLAAMKAAGVLDYAGVQFYDWTGFKVAGFVSGRVNTWVNTVMGGDASKVVVGFSANYTNGLDLAECIREWDVIKAAHPNIRGMFCWSAQTNIAGGNVWGTTMKPKLGAAPAAAEAPVVVVAETAMSDALAYAGGQNGAWFDPQAAHLFGTSAGTGAITTAGNLVGRLVDRSGNTNHANVQDASRGAYQLSGTRPYVHALTGYTSTTGGGSGDSNSNGFFFAYAGRPLYYFTDLYDDVASINTGRNVRYDAGIGGVIFSVGTGAARVSVQVADVTVRWENPNVNMRVNAWQDATHIYLQVNGGAVASTPCAACAVGSVHFTLSSPYLAPLGSNPMHLYQSFHTLNPLTAPLRAGVAAFVAAKIG